MYKLYAYFLGAFIMYVMCDGCRFHFANDLRKNVYNITLSISHIMHLQQ